MRILLGMPDPNSLGGPAACEPAFAEELRKLGSTVAEETYVYGETPEAVSTIDRVRRVIKTSNRLQAAAARFDPDIIHLNTSFDSRAVLRDAFVLNRLRGGRAKIFLKFHGSDLDLLHNASARMRPLVSSIMSRADGFGLLSNEELNAFLSAGVDGSKLFLVKNVVPPVQEISSARANIRHRMGVPLDTPVLLFIARFIPAKGLLDVIDALARLRRQQREVHLACVGDGEQRVEAEARITELRLQDRVHFTGYISEFDASEFYHGSTMLVFPTYHIEGFPMVIFKAMAAGLPIVTSRIRAAADYLREPENCLWTSPKDPNALATTIARLLDDEKLASSMSVNNRRHSSEFSAEAVTPEYINIYRSLVSS